MRLAPFVLAATMLATILLPIAARASDADVRAVLAVPRGRIESADYRVNGRLVRVDGSGVRTSYSVNIKVRWFPGVLRVLLEVVSPANARVHILLEMRPDGRNVIQIAHPGDAAPVTLPFDKWGGGPLGAGFSYEDFFEAQYFWPGQTALARAKFGTHDCDVVKSTPGEADKTHYAEVTSWLDHGIGFPLYVEKTLKDGMVKEFTYFGLRQNGGVWSARQVEAKVRGKAGSTLLIIDRGTPRANLSLKDFTPAQLTHF